MSQQTEPQPLSEDELSELDAFLLSDACDEDTLSVDEAHGFLTALIAGPEAWEESEWLPDVWGEPEFPSPEVEARMSDYLRRMHDDIAATLERRAEFEPLSVEVEEEGEVLVAYEGWCYGFMLGVDANSEAWEELPENEQNLIAPMAQLALLNSEEEPGMDDEEYESWVELLPGAVTGLYGFWHRG